jgi:hypothetical protein
VGSDYTGDMDRVIIKFEVDRVHAYNL